MRGIRSPKWSLAAALALAAGCATNYPENKCEIRVMKLEKLDERPGVFDVSYIVKGDAGTAGVVSLVARKASGEYISGSGVEVGPGPFTAAVEQKLTGRPAGLVVLLEVKQARCRAGVDLP